MKTLVLLSTILFSQNIIANTYAKNCYEDISKNISRHRSAILCQGTSNESESQSVKICYKEMTNLKIDRTRAAILCNRSFTDFSTKARISCYTSKNGYIAYQRSAILCAGIENLSESNSIRDCYLDLSKTINKDRAAVLCSKSTIGTWLLINNLYR
jgi:hypothetical protein